MPRTVDPIVYGVRRDAFVDAGAELIGTRGYERMSIVDILDATGASRGAFYHYFDSKEALLEAVLDRMIDQALALVEPILSDPVRPAPAKLRDVFAGIVSFKESQRPLVLGFLDVWLSDRNAVVREKLRRRQGDVLAAILEPVVRGGVDEGAFATTDPHATAIVLTSVMQGAGDAVAQLILDHRDGSVGFDDVWTRLDAYRHAFERILGAAPDSIAFIDRDTLRVWFESPSTIESA